MATGRFAGLTNAGVGARTALVQRGHMVAAFTGIACGVAYVVFRGIPGHIPESEFMSQVVLAVAGGFFIASGSIALIVVATTKKKNLGELADVVWETVLGIAFTVFGALYGVLHIFGVV